MADPKSKVQEVIEKLTDLKGYLDEEIKNYVEAKKHVDANHRVTDNKKLMRAAKTEIIAQVARIDSLILDNPEIGSLIGAPGDGEIESLNKTIADVLAKVEDLKSLGIKDAKGDDLRTDTGDVVARVEELNGSKPTRDYSHIDKDIADLEAIVVDEEQFKKYNEIKDKISKSKTPPMDLDDVDVAGTYKSEIAGIESKIATYKSYASLAKFDTSNFTKIQLLDTFTNSKNKPKAEQWFKLLKSVKGEEEVTIGSDKFKLNTLKDAEAFFAKFKGLSPKEFKKAMADLVAISKVSKTELEAKAGDIKSAVSSSMTMELFAEDKANIEAILGTNPVDLAKLETVLKGMKDPDKENFALLEKLAGDPAEITNARKELDRLKQIQARIKKEEEVHAEKPVAKEIGKFNIGSTEIELKKTKYKGDFVDLEAKEDYTDVVEATYAGLPIASIKKLNAMVEKESAATGDRLPRQIPFFSKLAAKLRGEEMTTREKAIAARVKGKIKAGIKSEQKASNRAATELHERDKTEATRAKDDLFRVDQETIDRIDEAARKFIIDQRGKTTVEQARNEAARDEEK